MIQVDEVLFGLTVLLCLFWGFVSGMYYAKYLIKQRNEREEELNALRHDIIRAIDSKIKAHENGCSHGH